MKKLLIGMALVAAVAAASAQDHNHGSRNGQSTHTSTHTSQTRTTSHNGGQQRTTGTYSHNSTHGSYTGGSNTSHRASHNYGGSSRIRSGTFGTSSGFGNHSYTRGSHSGHRGYSGGGGFGRVSGGGFRHTSIGHPSSWFANGWGRGPAYIHPRFNIYAGYTWNAMPTDAILVWVQDPATGEYYEAYYYPEYGYYAWYDQPLVAVGVYNPNISFVVRG